MKEGLGMLCRTLTQGKILQDDNVHEYNLCFHFWFICLFTVSPFQTNESMFALLEGEIMENSNAFVDSLMIEECLKDGKQLLITDLISLAISDGNLSTYLWI